MENGRAFLSEVNVYFVDFVSGSPDRCIYQDESRQRADIMQQKRTGAQLCRVKIMARTGGVLPDTCCLLHMN